MEALPDYRQPDVPLSPLTDRERESVIKLMLQEQMIPKYYLTPAKLKVADGLQLIVRRRGQNAELESVDLFGPPSDQFPVINFDGLGSGMP